jgi:subtilisin family serine protease
VGEGTLVPGADTAQKAHILEGQYIVVLANTPGLTGQRPEVRAPSALVAEGHAQRYGLNVTDVYSTVIKGYAAEMTEDEAARVEQDPGVAGVSPVQVYRPAVHQRFILPRQKLPTGVDRVDADRSDLADIDKKDERVDVDVAVIDTGIELEHPDLNVAGSADCSPAQEGVQDEDGHGTHVAGIIGALDNRFGVVGVAPGARIWSVRVFNEGDPTTDKDDGTDDRALLCAIEIVTRTLLDDSKGNDIEVANMSLGTSPSQQPIEDRNCGRAAQPFDVFHLAICNSVRAGMTYTVAAGNASSDAAFVSPAAYNEVITVSALEDYDGEPGGEGVPNHRCRRHIIEDRQLAPSDVVADDTFAWFSNFGHDVDVIAPGVCILSTYINDVGGSDAAKYGVYSIISGTSQAAPHAAGAAALYKAAHEDASPREVRDALIEAGRFNWFAKDDPDGKKEPLVNVSTFDGDNGDDDGDDDKAR